MGNRCPRPKKIESLASTSSSAHLDKQPFRERVFSKTSWSLLSWTDNSWTSKPNLVLPIAAANPNNAINCVVKAFVEATPISGPAFVIKCAPVSFTIELVSTLQMERVMFIPCSLADCNAASVSAVSPDCEITTTKVSGLGTLNL